MALRTPTFRYSCGPSATGTPHRGHELAGRQRRALRAGEEARRPAACARRRPRPARRWRRAATSTGSVSPAGDAVARLPPIVPVVADLRAARRCEPPGPAPGTSAGERRLEQLARRWCGPRGRPSPSATSPAPQLGDPAQREQPIGPAVAVVDTRPSGRCRRRRRRSPGRRPAPPALPRARSAREQSRWGARRRPRATTRPRLSSAWPWRPDGPP